jgi:hypothetical protein
MRTGQDYGSASKVGNFPHYLRTSSHVACKLLILGGAGGGGRTLMRIESRGILSPVRLPIPPLQQRAESRRV